MMAANDDGETGSIDQAATGATIAGIVLVADNFEEQVAFYRDVLGLTLTDHWGDVARFRAANAVELTLFAKSHDQASLDRIDPLQHGLSHFEFGVDDETASVLGQQLVALGQRSHGQNYLDRDGQLFHFVPKSDRS